MRILTIYILFLFAWSCQNDSQTKSENTIDKWNDLKIKDKPLLYKDPFVEIPLPNVKNIKGQTKFVNRENNFYIGYKIEFDIDHLDTTAIPKKYKVNKPIKGTDFEVLATTEVTYLVTFKFTLLDKDGFKLQEISSKAEYIRSGKKNEFQNLVEVPITNENTNLSRAIDLIISINECVTCAKDK